MEESEQKTILRRVTLYSYISGLPYFWFEELHWSSLLIHIHKCITKAISIINYAFLLASFVLWPLSDQKNWNQKQIYDIIMYNLTQPILYLSPISLTYLKKDVTMLVYELVISAPKVHNDPKVEREMVKKSKILLILIVANIWASLSMVGISCLVRVIIKDEVFNTIMTVWPDVEDRSHLAGAFRVMTYIAWWMMMFRLSGAVVIVVCLMTYTSHQFRQLQSYFCGLVNIFDQDLTQLTKEEKYEEALLVGIKFHVDVIRFTRKLVKTCNVTYGGDIMINVILIAIIMIRLANEESNLTNVIVSGQIAVTVLALTGCYMWTLGDITIEANNLTSAMYMSGWENCCGNSSLRVRKLLSVAMAQTQNPLTIYALSVIRVSYSSFVSIVKFSYTIFSVIV